LPYEALSRRRGMRLLGPPDHQRFIFGRGMMSDDGEHACIVAQCLCEWDGDVGRFQRRLAARLRWWLLGIPAGIGGATLRAILKLWIGIPPHTSGVYSAGNGPAMRSVILGTIIDDQRLREVVMASTKITHVDPKAFCGAMAVAIATRCASKGESGSAFLEQIRTALACDNASELIELLEQSCKSAEVNESTMEFAERIGCRNGVSGYMYHTVPVAIHAWLRNPSSYENAVSDAIRCGGDTDTVAAIAGGIVGAGVGAEGIPTEWRERLAEWPRNTKWIEKLAASVDEAARENRAVHPPRVGPIVLLRNLLFILVVMIHLARRALPPY
jgi:ADP-ribosyl-[dinitrogen reductase] hydrolase